MTEVNWQFFFILPIF